MSNRKTALITGITGQDGSYLAELLLEKTSGVQTRVPDLMCLGINAIPN